MINIFGKLSFSSMSVRKKEKSVVSFTHEQNIICSQTLKPNTVGRKLRMSVDLCCFNWLLARQISDGRKICPVWRWWPYNISELYKMNEAWQLNNHQPIQKKRLAGSQATQRQKKKGLAQPKRIISFLFKFPLHCLCPRIMSLYHVTDPSGPSVSELFMIKRFRY